jgi:hypothetical protein
MIRYIPPITLRQQPTCRAPRRTVGMSFRLRLNRILAPGGRKRTAITRSAVGHGPP